MDHFTMLPTHEQLVETIAYTSVNVLSRIDGTLCGPLEIPGESPVVQAQLPPGHLPPRTIACRVVGSYKPNGFLCL